MSTIAKPKTVVVAGVGPGLGAALVHKFTREGCQVAMLARSRDYLEKLMHEVRDSHQGVAIPVPVDLAEPTDVENAFKEIRRQFNVPDVLIYNASSSSWGGIDTLTSEQFEQTWRVSVFGAFLCCQQVAEGMSRRRGGAILFTGATSGIRGRKGALDFSSAKYALRGLADSLARELWPHGVHVAHIIIDGIIDTHAVREKFHPKPGEPLLHPSAIAETYWSLTVQEPSAWTLELDLRPHDEEFFT